VQTGPKSIRKLKERKPSAAGRKKGYAKRHISISQTGKLWFRRHMLGVRKGVQVWRVLGTMSPLFALV
jgi:hypothetical protein